MSDVATWVGWGVISLICGALVVLALAVIAVLFDQSAKMIAYKALADKGGLWKEDLSLLVKLLTLWELAMRRDAFGKFYQVAGEENEWALDYRGPFDWEVTGPIEGASNDNNSVS